MKTSAHWLAILLVVVGYAPAAGQEIVPTSAIIGKPSDAATQEADRIRHIIRSLGAHASTPAQLVQLTRELEPSLAAQTYLQVAHDYLQAEHTDLAAQVLAHMAEQYPAEPQTLDANLLLVQLYSSGELAHTQRSQDGNTTGQLNLPPGWQRPTIDTRNHMSTYALHLANKQVQQHPKLAKQSDFAFQCATSARLAGNRSATKNWLTLVKHKSEFPQWRSRALAEDWLELRPDKEPPVPVTTSQNTATPPHLDGILNEPCWEAAQPIIAVSNQQQPASEVFIAYDSKHLYLAARCQRIAAFDYRPSNQPRTYDADLTGQDRLQISLDVDRDYSSCYHLTVDHRGGTNDTCFLNTSWNPQWYVATGGGQFWTFEAAIPWAELVDHPPQSGDAWALDAVRLSPTQVANGNDSFRLLLFR